MQAARVHPKRKTFVLEDVPVPEIGPGEVLVKVHAAGLSRGLISVLLFTDMIKLLPATLGHEIAGVVAATGPGVSGFRTGDRVHVYAPLGCRRESCAACAEGNESECPSFAMIGYALFQPDGMPAYERYHNVHHENGPYNFGISHPLFDVIFRTYVTAHQWELIKRARRTSRAATES